MTKPLSPDTVPADPSKWSESSQQSVSAAWTTEYTSLRYKCWRCGESSVFSAEEQRYTYEVKKANINQQRILCKSCWHRLREIDKELRAFDDRWSTAKQSIKNDRSSLECWSKLLEERDQYVPYRADVAKKGMLAKLLRNT